ncbi:hypothetical protein GCM10010371_67220 [Streptomyces subrutilus]|uniref:Uncharacterized protein n=1 Tax=Streptomyces subrutilus TaxID=36818 RepID=A0A5P2UT26_9ACTN|nr:hypothetical protein [Streptomyces subrutilus]QEU82273.1 hypothetical protein CP968_31960 [Streptomyces subrutilus]GGZ98068.1 hypothetical protein GCM10010371_67220 [Streptomyces subrutilus]
MTLPKKGSRRIVVNGVAYRWRVRRRPTYDQGMSWSPLTYAVEQADAPGTTLMVRTDRPHPGNWMSELTFPVLPSSVAAAVQAAREKGWTPEAPGSPFLLDETETTSP